MIQRAKKVNIIGPYPPPFGGISVHIQRMFDHIRHENVRFFNTSTFKSNSIPTLTKFDLLFLFFKPNQLIHYHSTSINVRLILAICSVLNPFIFFHAHGASLVDQLNSLSWKSRIIKFVLPRLNIICSNSEIYAHFESNYSPRSLHLYDAFIPPLYDENLYNEVINSVELPNTTFLLSMTGWFSIYNNEDLYGFDLMLQALDKLRKQGIDVSIIASVNGIGDQELYNSFIAERARLSLTNNFYLIMNDLPELYPIIIASDIFIRPTNTDGNAVSIKEATWFNKLVIASDAVPRPDEVITFKNRNLDNLVNTISDQLLHIKKGTQKKFVDSTKFKHPMIKEIYGFK